MAIVRRDRSREPIVGDVLLNQRDRRDRGRIDAGRIQQIVGQPNSCADDLALRDAASMSDLGPPSDRLVTR